MKNRLELLFEKASSPAEYAKGYVTHLSELMQELDFSSVQKMVELFLQAREKGQTIFFIGNGGSASTCSHFANDLGNLAAEGAQTFRAVSLTDNTAFITALANDDGYENIFVNQLKNIYKPGDLLVGISGSGNSENIIRAVKYVRERKGTSIGIIGFEGGMLKSLCDHIVHIKTPPREYGPMEDICLVLDHLLGSYLAYSNGLFTKILIIRAIGTYKTKKKLFLLMKIKAIILDFDGVILESVDIKTDAFREMFSVYPDKVDAIVNYHLNNNGISRMIKIRKIYEEMLKLPYTKETEKECAEKFSSLVFKHVVQCPFVPGAENFLKTFHTKVPLTVASASPDEELKRVIAARGLKPYFVEVYGHPTHKREVVASVLKRNDLKGSDVLYVGDSQQDYRVAQEFDLFFIGRQNKEAFEEKPKYLFDDLSQIQGWMNSNIEWDNAINLRTA